MCKVLVFDILLSRLLQKNILHLHTYTKNKNTNIYKFPLSSWAWITYNEEVFLKLLQSGASMVSTFITAKVHLKLSSFNNLFFKGMVVNLDINVYIIARKINCFQSAGLSTGPGRSPTTPAGHRTTLADIIIYRRWPAPVRYVTTQLKILKYRPVPRRVSNSPVILQIAAIVRRPFYLWP